MTGGLHQVDDRLRELVIAGDLAALRGFVDQLTGADLKAARSWVKTVQDVDRHPWPKELGDRADPDYHARGQQMRLGRLVTWARLGAPGATVKALATEETYLDDDHLAQVVDAFVDHDRTWVESFAAAADVVSPTARGAGTVRVLLDAVVRAHGLPTPAGSLFHQGWIRQVQSQVEPPSWMHRTPTLDNLLADSLLPEVVYLQLASGEVGAWPSFGQVLPTLVEAGLIDRVRTLAIALEQLSAGQKPSSQKAMAGVLTALELRADEVPGGLAHLVSVLSSCHGSAAGVVLSLAIDMVATDADAVDLAHVLAPRPEKALRRQLLAALSPTHLGRDVSAEGLLDAIDALAAGDVDVADQARYAKARAALGVVADPDGAVEFSESLGLWELTPACLATQPFVRSGLTVRDVAKQQMRARSKGWESPQATEIVLDALARHTLTTWDLVGVAHELDAEGRLSPTRSASFFEALFLGGAIQLAWPAAVRTAALAATGRPRPGLDRLLAMLCSYAAEPPRPVRLPAQVVRLAGGSTKAALEADRLVRLLDADPDPADPHPVDLTLWDETSERPPDGLAYPPHRDLDSVGRRLADGSDTGWGVADPRGRVRRSLALEELVALIEVHGADGVRARAAEGITPEAWPIAQAVVLWSSGLLDVACYWRMVTGAVSVADKPLEWRTEHGAMHSWSVLDGVQIEPPVLPWWWKGGDDLALEFLHACEVLLVAERGGAVLSTPDRLDGALGLDVLLSRLSSASTVGPIDLRLALARLRPTHTSDSAGIAGSLRTDPALTVAEGDRGLDAFELVREWVADGGVRCAPGPDLQGQPTFQATAPWPWDSIAALSHRTVPEVPWLRRDQVFRLPARPDVWLRNGLLVNSSGESLADVGGRLGTAGWTIVLGALATVPPDYTSVDFAALVRLQRQDRLDPAVAVAAATQGWDAGQAELLGDAVGWEQAFLRGALRGLWPVAVGVVEAGLARPERPGGIDGMLDVLRRYAHHVPPDVVPSWLAEA